MYLLFKVTLGCLNDIGFRETFGFIKKNIAHQKGVFAFNGLRSADVVNRRQLTQWDLMPATAADIDFFKVLQVVTQFTLITHTNGITFATINHLRKRFAADCNFNQVLHFTNMNTVTGNRRTVNFNFEIGFTNNSIRNH